VSTRKAYQKNSRDEVHARLAKEWVPLDGGEVCVWEMTAAEMLSLGQQSARPSMDPRGGVDTTTAALLLAAFCTHAGEEIDSPRIWEQLQVLEIQSLRGEEFTRLQEAIQRVNGTAKEAVEGVRDFTTAPEGLSTSASPSSASSNSGAVFPPNSPISLTAS
jgi:hypothetical protein